MNADRGDHDAFGAIDPDEVGGRPRWRRWLVVAAACAAAGAAIAVTVTVVTDDDPSTRRAPIVVLSPLARPLDATTGDTVAAAALDAERRHVIDAVPDGFAPAYVFDSVDIEGEAGDRPSNAFALFAAAGARIGSGPWLSIEIAELDPRDARQFSATRFVRERSDQRTAPDVVDVGGLAGAVGVDMTGIRLLAFGPVDGRSISVHGVGVPTETMLGFARSLAIDDATAALAANAITTSLPLLSSGNDISGFYGSLYGGDDSTTVAYTSEDHIESLTLTSSIPTTSDPFGVVAFMLVEPDETTVHGQRALVGEQDPTLTGGQPSTVVVWVEDGRQITMVGGEDADAMVAIAESVRPAVDDEWDDLQSEADARQDDVDDNDNDPFARGTFLIDAGNTDDGTRWRIEASNDDGLGVCSMGSANSGSECTSFGDIDGPALHRVGSTWAGYVGVIAIGTGTGDALVIEVEGREQIDLALHEIDATFPGPAAAFAASSDQSFTATLVAGDGTVLDTVEVTGSGR